MKIIMGLGNPGVKWHRTRHNMGFDVIDVLANRWCVRVDDYRLRSLLAKTSFAGEEIYLVKPQTMMNLSGLAMREFMLQKKATSEDLILIYDDMDLPVGRIRIKSKGSPAGHNGVKSVSGALECLEFVRLRVGIGRPPEWQPTADFVTELPTKDERKVLDESIWTAAEAVEMIIEDGIDVAMGRYNGVNLSPQEA